MTQHWLALCHQPPTIVEYGVHTVSETIPHGKRHAEAGLGDIPRHDTHATAEHHALTGLPHNHRLHRCSERWVLSTVATSASTKGRVGAVIPWQPSREASRAEAGDGRECLAMSDGLGPHETHDVRLCSSEELFQQVPATGRLSSSTGLVGTE